MTVELIAILIGALILAVVTWTCEERDRQHFEAQNRARVGIDKEDEWQK